MDALHLLEKQKDKKPFEVSLREAIQMIWVKLSQLEQAPACIPPCGHQPAARIFQCSTCRLVDCQFPVDCPVQDLWVHEDEAITLHCDVPFAVPPELQVTWMFAKDGTVGSSPSLPQQAGVTWSQARSSASKRS
ncbi:sperm acrosome membrane-associated protein 6-like isoform X2 [Tympanuchus pallidicinctus]|uniref:sperm acrosome membrane-associated protein 6-like isoform X2 n=1 Tax=Tympanuchus pallidicinctus TaxID=109042 RepID=UPI002286CF58|nr:sperm acrosome membrane-associated protein 6-like isoform X2 [Tympanuchus pallidicinctus]